MHLQETIESHTIWALGDAVAWSIQVLLRHCCLEVEARIDTFHVLEGPLLFGGRMTSTADPVLALPDNLGARLKEVGAP